MKQVGWVSIFCAVFVASSFWSGFVLCWLWSWFVVPTFGVAQISVVEAVGLTVIGHFVFRRGLDPNIENLAKWFKSKMVPLAVEPAIALGIGWCWSLAL